MKKLRVERRWDHYGYYPTPREAVDLVTNRIIPIRWDCHCQSHDTPFINRCSGGPSYLGEWYIEEDVDGFSRDEIEFVDIFPNKFGLVPDHLKEGDNWINSQLKAKCINAGHVVKEDA